MNILFVGSRGIPKMGTAEDMRLTFFANAISDKNDITIINRYSSALEHKLGDLHLANNIRVREIINSKKTGSFITKALLFLSVLYEPFVIISENKRKKVQVLHLYTGHYIDMLLYRIISKLLKIKVVYQYVEYRSEIKRSGLYHRINGWLCDNKAARLWDGVIPISDFLEKKALEINPTLKSLKVTPLCDFDYFEQDSIKPKISSDYILFCGSISYIEPIDLIVESYRKSKLAENAKLVLVLSGSEDSLNIFRQNNSDVVVLTRLPYSELISYYKNAKLLLIPLRNTIQDIARFPNKICEYTACKGAILTTKVGEVLNYFKDGENAIVAEDFSIHSYTLKMDEVYGGKYNLEALRNNAYELGKNCFSINAYSEPLNEFLNSL